MTSKYYIDITIENPNGQPMGRVATTFRIDPVVRDGLSKLSTLRGRSLNSLANEALREFVAKRTLEAESELEASLEDLRAYRKSDPDFAQAIAAFVEAEIAVEPDPAEGRVVEQTGPAESAVLNAVND